MNRLDRCRRAASILLVLTCVILVPSVAMAKFTSNTAPALSMTTDTMAVLTSVTGTFSCTKSGPDEAISISVTGFTDTGPAGSTYTYQLLLGATVKDTGTSTTNTRTLTATQRADNNPTTWTLTIQAKLFNWTGPVVTKSVICNTKSDNSGPL